MPHSSLAYASLARFIRQNASQETHLSHMRVMRVNILTSGVRATAHLGLNVALNYDCVARAKAFVDPGRTVDIGNKTKQNSVKV